MAYHLGISQSQYSRRENGSVEFTVSEIEKIASILGVAISELFNEGSTLNEENQIKKQEDFSAFILELKAILSKIEHLLPKK